MSDNIPKIPNEIALEILKRVDFKTLVKCTSVCKLWKSIITTPSFISHHFHSTNTTQTESLLFQICCRENDSICREIYSLRSDDEEMELLRAVEDPPIHRFKNRRSFFRVVGTCNGIVCVVDSLVYSFVLWNPALRKYILLPRLNVLLLDKASLGFGFDSTHNDFKVVRLVNGITNLEALVCSSATRSWKSITSQVPPCFVRVGKANVFMNGKLHCVAKHRRNDRQNNFILTLDLAEEAFGEISLPQRIGEEGSMASICVLARGESLAVSHVEEGLESPIFGLWVMKEYGVVESWTRVVRIVDEELIPKNVLALRKNGEMILELRNGDILKYNPTTTTIEDLGFRGDRVFIGYHKESLFLLDKGKGVMSYTY